MCLFYKIAQWLEHSPKMCVSSFGFLKVRNLNRGKNWKFLQSSNHRAILDWDRWGDSSLLPLMPCKSAAYSQTTPQGSTEEKVSVLIQWYWHTSDRGCLVHQSLLQSQTWYAFSYEFSKLLKETARTFTIWSFTEYHRSFQLLHSLYWFHTWQK